MNSPTYFEIIEFLLSISKIESVETSLQLIKNDWLMRKKFSERFEVSMAEVMDFISASAESHSSNAYMHEQEKYLYQKAYLEKCFKL